MRLTNPASLDLVAILRAPVDRLDDVPLWGKTAALAASVWQLALAFLQRDAFNGILLLVIAAGVADYAFGVKAAKSATPSTYDPRIAHKGAMGKISGVMMLLLVRLFEAWSVGLGVVDTKGALAVGLAVSLFAVDLQSIAHHREAYGARPIPFLSRLMQFLQDWAAGKVPPSGPASGAPPSSGGRG